MTQSVPFQFPDPSVFIPQAGALHVVPVHDAGLSVQAQRALSMLAHPDCFGRTALVAGQVSIIGKRGGISLVVGQVDLMQIDALVQSGHVLREGQGDVLTYRLRRHGQVCGGKPAPASLSRTPALTGKRKTAVRVGQESPLRWLSRRKDKAGQALISSTALAAGERLQQDFMQAGMSPKMTADWSGLPASGAGASSGALLHSERQMAAQQRLRRALEACGADLSGVLLDLCCFLKPLEAVEQERGWPARSGKVILKLALSALMRHYGLSESAQGPARSRQLQSWHAPILQDQAGPDSD